MKIIPELTKAMEAIGGSLDEGLGYTINLDAPPGYVWCANDSPTYAIHHASNSQSWLVQAMKNERTNLRMGLEKVTNPQRLEEIRWNNGDDDWGAPESAPTRLAFTI